MRYLEFYEGFPAAWANMVHHDFKVARALEGDHDVLKETDQILMLLFRITSQVEN